jgi:hypothetical protein
MAGPRRRPLLLALAAALMLGLAGRVALGALRAAPDVPHSGALTAVGAAVVALGAPWLAAAWVVGALAGSRRAAPLAGAAALGLGTGAWYALTVAAHGPAAVPYALPVGLAWAAVAVAAGALFAAAGAAWRHGGPVARAAGAAALAGALAGEAVALAGHWAGRAADAVLMLELAAAGALLLLAARHRAAFPLAVGLTIVAAIGVAVAEDTVRDALRLTGWTGP